VRTGGVFNGPLALDTVTNVRGLTPSHRFGKHAASLTRGGGGRSEGSLRRPLQPVTPHRGRAALSTQPCGFAIAR
jgi:hypothetical protein